MRTQRTTTYDGTAQPKVEGNGKEGEERVFVTREGEGSCPSRPLWCLVWQSGGRGGNLSGENAFAQEAPYQ